MAENPFAKAATEEQKKKYESEKKYQNNSNSSSYKKTGNSSYSGQQKNYSNQQDSDISKIIVYIESFKEASLKDILDPVKYALPVQENGEKGWAIAVAKNLKGEKSADAGQAINSNQLRKIFSEIKNIERLSETEEDYQQHIGDVLLLMPQIAYAYSRGIVKADFYQLMKSLITRKNMASKADYQQFVYFYEAIIAYFNVRED